MNLNLSLSDPKYDSFKIVHPVKNLYVAFDGLAMLNIEYITLYIGNMIISHTNQFTKIINQNKLFYRLDFFQNSLTLPMNIINYHDISLKKTVWYIEDHVIKTKIINISEIYYEIDDKYIAPSNDLNESKELCQPVIQFCWNNDTDSVIKVVKYETTSKCIAYPIIHINTILNKRFPEAMKIYGLNENWHNLLQIESGMCGLIFS